MYYIENLRGNIGGWQKGDKRWPADMGAMAGPPFNLGLLPEIRVMVGGTSKIRIS